MVMDQLDAMRVFVAVAQQRSFAGAARQLRLSASVVTRAVAQLEDQLAQTLLARTTRSVRLTAWLGESSSIAVASDSSTRTPTRVASDSMPSATTTVVST